MRKIWLGILSATLSLSLLSGCKSYDREIVKAEKEILALPEQKGYGAPFDQSWEKSVLTHQQTRTELSDRYSPMDKKKSEIVMDFHEISSLVSTLKRVSKLDLDYLKEAKIFYTDLFESHVRVIKVYRHLELVHLLLNRTLVLSQDMLEASAMNSKDASTLQASIEHVLVPIYFAIQSNVVQTGDELASLKKIDEGLEAELKAKGMKYVSLETLTFRISGQFKAKTEGSICPDQTLTGIYENHILKKINVKGVWSIPGSNTKRTIEIPMTCEGKTCKAYLLYIGKKWRRKREELQIEIKDQNRYSFTSTSQWGSVTFERVRVTSKAE